MHHKHLPPVEVGTGVLFRKGKRIPVIVEGNIELSIGDTVPCNLAGTIVVAEIVNISKEPKTGLVICIEYRPNTSLPTNVVKFENPKETTAS